MPQDGSSHQRRPCYRLYRIEGRNDPVSYPTFKRRAQKKTEERKRAHFEARQYIMSFQTSDFTAVLEKIINPSLTVHFEKNDFLQSPIFALCKQYFMTWKTMKKYKTPEKYRKKNISWRDIPKEEKIEHSAYKWYRNHREQELNKAAGKKKLRRKNKSNKNTEEWNDSEVINDSFRHEDLVQRLPDTDASTGDELEGTTGTSPGKMAENDKTTSDKTIGTSPGKMPENNTTTSDELEGTIGTSSSEMPYITVENNKTYANMKNVDYSS